MVFASVMTRPRALFLSGLVALTAGAPALAEPRYRDGDYSGQVFDTGWGEVQMKAIIRGGALVDVQYLQFPYHRLRSMQISNEALPQLKAEAIKNIKFPFLLNTFCNKNPGQIIVTGRVERF